MKKILVLTILIVANLFIFGQSPKKWKNITKEDFKYLQNEDITAEAIILQEEAKYYFDVWREELKIFVDVHRRILITDTVGLDYATVKIPYIAENKYDEIIFFRGFTYNLKKGKIKRKRLRGRHIEDKKISEKKNVKIARFPKVKPGSVIEYKYTFTTLNMLELKTWYFQHKIPCLYSSVKLNLPEFISYQINKNGIGVFDQKKKEESSMYINYTFHYDDPIPGGLTYYNKSFNAPVSFRFRSWFYTFTMKNISAYKKRPLTDCEHNYRKNLNFYLVRVDKNNGLTNEFDIFAWEHLTRRLYQSTIANYKIKKLILTHNSETAAGYVIFNVLNWDDADSKLKKHKDFGIELLKNWNFRQELDAALKNNPENDLQKMIDIYYYVRNNYHWNGKYNIYTSDNLEKIAQIKKGRSSDINLMLVYLLKKANLKAFPVLIRTVDKGHILDYPSYNQFNHVIAAVKINDETYFLDAINKEIPWFLLDKNDLNQKGRAFENNKSYFIDVKPNLKSSLNSTSDISIKNNFAKCNILINERGYKMLKKCKNLSNCAKKYSNNFSNISDFNYNFDKSEKKLVTELSFSTNDIISENKIYPFDLFSIEYKGFNNPERNIPIYFGYRFQKRYVVNLQIPKNNSIKSFPQNFYKNYDGIDAYGKVLKSDTSIKLIFQIDVKKVFFETDKYSDLRDLFIELDYFINTPIVFENKL